MDKKRRVLNLSASIVSRFLLLAAAFIVRRPLIHQIGNEVNGLNSLYASLIGTLTVAEMGVGRAYTMNSPIIDGNRQRV